eukprot:Plantae.Rhodophyta-Hildenbrandia_rubra.ctg9056.p1 GENE.Plantae.Rhodophyta-Hildenbrandia_rubra.ctg9056~~Plantae.Rhodophyta-Hildenbrandia_rubra.ctg9056.p1  ORF type:complete len:688 (+),score=106.34 Plantae.Rhodophyta-Hildenbrandia_rubra.ctg9056:578-2641(+)
MPRRSARLLARRNIVEQGDVTVDDHGGDCVEPRVGSEEDVRSGRNGKKRKVECLGMDDSDEDRRGKLRRVVDDGRGKWKGSENEGKNLVCGDDRDEMNVQVGSTSGNSDDDVEEGENTDNASDDIDDDIQVVKDKSTLKQRKAANEARAAEMPEIDNDVRQELPSTLVHVPRRDLGRTAKSCGIPYMKALIGFYKYRGEYHPKFRGIVIPSCCLDDMNYAIKLREERKTHRGNISESRAEYLLEQKARVQELQKEGESERRVLMENALKKFDWEENQRFPYFFQNLVDRFIRGEMMPYVVELRRCSESKMTVTRLKNEAREVNVNINGLKLKQEIIQKLADAVAERKSDLDVLVKVLESKEAHHVRSIVRARKAAFSLAERLRVPHLKSRLWERIRSTATRTNVFWGNTPTERTSSFCRIVAEPALDELVCDHCTSIIRKHVSSTWLKVRDWNGAEDKYLAGRLEEIINAPWHRTTTNKDSLMSVEELAKNAADQFLVEVEQYKRFYACAREDARNRLQVIHAWLKTHGEGLFDNYSCDQLERSVFSHHEKSSGSARTLPSSFIICIRRLVGDRKAAVDSLLPSSMIRTFANVVKEVTANVTTGQNCALSGHVLDLAGRGHVEVHDFFSRLPFETRLAICGRVCRTFVLDARQLAMASPSMRSAVACLCLEESPSLGVYRTREAICR